jgi:hypothetical protein
MYRGTITGLRISAVDGGATASGGAFVDNLFGAVGIDQYDSVTMTAADSGSSGINVVDNDDIDFGTGNFTLVWKGSLPDWTPGAEQTFIRKDDGANGWQFSLYSDNKPTIYLRGATVTLPKSTEAPTISDGNTGEIAVVVTRETAIAAGSVVYYFNGAQLGNSVALTTGVPVTMSGSALLYVSGTAAKRVAATTLRALAFNRALSSAEVISLYTSGVAEADKWGNQTTPTPGCVLALEPSGIKAAGWLDSSTNDLDASYPAAGATLNPKYADGNHQIEIYDSAGRMLKGVLKAAGTGETSTTIDSDTCAADNTVTWPDKISGTLVFDTDHYIIDPSSTACRMYFRENLSMVVNRLYSFDLDLKNGTGTGTNASVQIYDSSASTTSAYFDTTASYVTKRVFRTSRANTAAGQAFVRFEDNFAGNVNIKNAIVKALDTPSSSGSTIVSAKGGVTYNFTSKDASFTYNVASYNVVVRRLR